MDLNSSFFDPLRIGDQEPVATGVQGCARMGCSQAGAYKAPKGRDREGEYYHFCLEHVKDYNRNYNYFAGMGYEDLLTYQNESITGLRPTWRMGYHPAEQHNIDARKLFDEAFATPRPAATPAPSVRRITPMVKKSFETMGLPTTSTSAEIAKHYKLLIKRLHPDANGGDRSTEDQFRAVVEAHDVLKSCGFC